MESVNINELFSTKMCSPLIVFIVIVVILRYHYLIQEIH